MKAMVQDRYGQPDVLTLREVERPTPRAGEVLLRVRASSVNPADLFFVTGTPYPLRLMAGVFRPTQPTPGRDVAGVVEAVGPGVTRFSVGDEVYGEVHGAYAEYLRAPEKLIAHKPSNLDFASAGVAPLAAMAALRGLRDGGRVKAGDRVLVHGASGGVGTFAVQLAKFFGAEVTAVTSGKNAELVRSIGADHVIDYTKEDIGKSKGAYDVVLDLIGTLSISGWRATLKPSGVYVASVGRTGWSLAALVASLWPFGRGRVSVAMTNDVAGDLTELTRIFQTGEVVPVIDRRFALSEVPEALRYLATGRTRGKSAVVV